MLEQVELHVGMTGEGWGGRSVLPPSCNGRRSQRCQRQGPWPHSVGLFPDPFHTYFECPKCCFRLSTPEQATGVSGLSSIRTAGMQ